MIMTSASHNYFRRQIGLDAWLCLRKHIVGMVKDERLAFVSCLIGDWRDCCLKYT
jgi:1,2-phenylacetyl-CoA epoxidase PaaB subunit